MAWQLLLLESYWYPCVTDPATHRSRFLEAYPCPEVTISGSGFGMDKD